LGLLNGLKPKRLTSCIEQKLQIDFRHGNERNGWYCIEGKQTLRVTIPKVHGSSDLSPFVANKVKNQLRLTKQEFRDLYNCPMSGSDYRKKIEYLQSQEKL
jgi:hypothetical protein